jgi:MFS family permease
MAVTYFAQGFRTFIDLSVMDLFKDYLKLEPAEMQVLTSIICFPWSLKPIYGLIADNLPIFGSKRRSYVALSGLMQFTFLIPLIPAYIESEYVIAGFLTIYAMSVAFNDSIIDALMVMQSRRDPERGSEELNSYSWLWLAFGGIVGSISAGFLT